ncbi:CU044_5270 family protein [Streptomyces yaizuensis]|nr:CU044_5270 family protein [Streptomyces sp. YSPA8]
MNRPPFDDGELRELGGLLPPPPVPGLAPDRELMLREAVLRKAAATVPPGAPGRREARAPRRRLFTVLVPALACSLAVGGVLVLDLDAPDRSAREAAPVAGDSTPGAHPAARLLDRVALAAAERSRPAVRADQFVYVESRVAHTAQNAGGGAAVLEPVRTRRIWLSADGSRPGLLREEGRPDTVLGDGPPVHVVDGPGATPRPVHPRPERPSVTAPTHRYVASLPTDPGALLRLIREETRGQGQHPDQRAFTAIGELLTETWAPPEVSAALYRAAARIPGVTVIPSATDASGRTGVAVARTAYGQQTQWIFDRTTYAFLGERTVLTESGAAGPAGTVVGTSAVLTTAAVDRAGRTPGRTAG